MYIYYLSSKKLINQSSSTDYLQFGHNLLFFNHYSKQFTWNKWVQFNFINYYKSSNSSKHIEQSLKDYSSFLL
jgi:hypothetical protein